MPCPQGSAKGGPCCDHPRRGRIVPACPLRTDIPARCRASLVRWMADSFRTGCPCVTPSVSSLPTYGHALLDVRWRCAFLRTVRSSASRGRNIREVRRPMSWRRIPQPGSRSPRVGNRGMKPSRRGRSVRAEFGLIYQLIYPYNSTNDATHCLRTAHDMWLCVMPEPRVHCLRDGDQIRGVDPARTDNLTDN
jgi:hypothetical protein